MAAALGYLGFIYWPLVEAYVPGMAKEAPKVEVGLPAAPTATITKGVEGALTKEAEEAGDQAAPVKVELVDPFLIRVALKSSSAPTEKPEEPEVIKVAEPVLEGIWVDSGMRVAFISGQAVIEGGGVMGWRVKKITKTQVLLTKGSRKKILKLEGIQ